MIDIWIYIPAIVLGILLGKLLVWITRPRWLKEYQRIKKIEKT